jgi:hypothetical protein
MEMLQESGSKEYAYFFKDKMYKVPVVTISLEDGGGRMKSTAKSSSPTKVSGKEIDWNYYTKYLGGSPSYLDNYYKKNSSSKHGQSTHPERDNQFEEESNYANHYISPQYEPAPSRMEMTENEHDTHVATFSAVQEEKKKRSRSAPLRTKVKAKVSTWRTPSSKSKRNERETPFVKQPMYNNTNEPRGRTTSQKIKPSPDRTENRDADPQSFGGFSDSNTVEYILNKYIMEQQEEPLNSSERASVERERKRSALLQRIQSDEEFVKRIDKELEKVSLAVQAGSTPSKEIWQRKQAHHQQNISPTIRFEGSDPKANVRNQRVYSILQDADSLLSKEKQNSERLKDVVFVPPFSSPPNSTTPPVNQRSKRENQGINTGNSMEFSSGQLRASRYSFVD